MEPLPPIPTPPSQSFREFRIRVLPAIIFLVVLAVVIVLWRSYVLPTSIVGMVQTNTVSITYAEPGVITDVFVKPDDLVTNGQPLCIIRPSSPELTRASMDKIVADMNVLRGRLALNDVRNTESAAKFRIDLFIQQTSLAVAKVRLVEAELNLDRKSKLRQEDIVAQAEFELARTQRDAYKTEVAERTRLVDEWDKELAALKPQQSGGSNLDKLIQDAITKQQEEINALNQPIVLRSPINGQVSEVRQFAGQHIYDREPILTINSTGTDRIIAFLRQPIAIHPKTNDQVLVRTRGPHRQQIVTEIIEVGTQLEPIDPMLTPWSTSRRAVEMGLPVAIRMPTDLKMLPGELVELSLVIKK